MSEQRSLLACIQGPETHVPGLPLVALGFTGGQEGVGTSLKGGSLAPKPSIAPTG